MNKRKMVSVMIRRMMSFALLSLFIAVCLSITVMLDGIDYSGNKTAYKTSLSQISSYDIESLEKVSITDFYDANDGVYAGIKAGYESPISKVITISDGKQLYAFSRLCNDSEAFLAFNYQLTTNINYIAQYPFIPIAWRPGQAFNGIFDGQGYEVINMQFIPLTPDNQETYETMEYFAMFSTNNGTVKNIGLVETNFSINVTNLVNKGVAPLIGLNNSVVENVFVKDLRDPVRDEAGITAAGGYRLSGLMVENSSTGRFINAYTAYSILSNYTINDYISFREIVDMNNGYLENIYFYDGTIDQVTDTHYVFTPGLVNISIPKDSMVGTYMESIASLNAQFVSLSSAGWFTSASYSTTVSNSIDIETPILRGLTETLDYHFEIKTALDYAYVYELMNQNALFSSSECYYEIVNDLDLSTIPGDSYKYDSYVSAHFTGRYDANRNTLISVTNSYSGYPTISNFSIMNSIKEQGIHAYGLMPLFSGTFENINLYYDKVESFDVYESSVTVKSIGLLCGISEGAKIKNVNLYGDLILNTSDSVANHEFGRYYVGMLAGILTQNSNVDTITTSGSINGGTHSSTVINNVGISGYLQGNSLGGIVGYVTINGADIKNVLAAVELTATIYNQVISFVQAIGGVIGSGYSNDWQEITNKSNITIGSDSNNNYGVIYAAGVIGRHLGETQEVTKLHNQGNINYYLASNSAIAYLSGVANVDIITAEADNLLVSPFRDNRANRLYYASAFTNSGDILITKVISSTTNTSIYLAGITYIKAANGFISKVSGFYNLGYYYNVSGANVKANDLEIDMSAISRYAPCFVSNAVNASQKIEAEGIYNLRNMKFYTTDSPSFTYFNYAGAFLGKYIEITDARNEGNMSFQINHSFSNTARNIYINGVFEEVSQGFKANVLFNGGDIDFYIGSTQYNNLTVYSNLFISGICYANRNVISEEEYDPLSKKYDSSKAGSINNAINNGSISSNSYTLGRPSADLTAVDGLGASYNNATTVSQNLTLRGNVRISGITCVNEGIISNSFNLGNIDNYGFCEAGFYLESAGISWINVGRYAKIRDCANNGKIKTINMSRNASFAHSAGITIRNERLENEATYASNAYHHLQMISFTINYGDIYTFNYYNNITNLGNEAHAKSAGILAIGLCGALNTVNYGSIYSSESGASLYALVQFYRFASEVDANNKVSIANTLNYGNVRAINKFYNDNGTIYLTYMDVLQAGETKMDYIGIGFQGNPYYQYIGAMISIINYGNTANATTASNKCQYIDIRYLINFFELNLFVASEINIPSSGNINLDVSTIASVRPNANIIGQQVTYAPLTSESTENGTVGVFSEDFILRQAIDGRIDTSTILTDSYLSDYFQFVAFSKINQTLLDSIGWSSIAYLDASERFAKDLDSIAKLMTNYSSISASTMTRYNELSNEALDTSSWISRCDPEVLKKVFDSITSGQSKAEIKEIISFLFFNSTNKALLTAEYRKSVIQMLVDSLDASKSELITILDNLMYNDLFADIIAGSDLEYESIKEAIGKEISTLSADQLRDLASDYIDLLNSGSPIFDVMFSDAVHSNSYLKAKQELIATLLTGLDDSILDDILRTLDKASGVVDNSQYILAIARLSDAQKKNIYTALLTYNSTADMSSTVISVLKRLDISTYTVEGETVVINDFAENLTEELDKMQASDAITNLDYSVTDVDYTKFWNNIKKDINVKNYLTQSLGIVSAIDGKSYNGIYSLATEYRNTYQSNDSPSTSYTSGKLRVSSASAAPTTRFIFTKDEFVSDSTYYYGPYRDTSNTILKLTVDANTGYNQGYVLSTAEGSSTSTIYVPIFIGLDEDYVKGLIASSSNPDTYKFIWNNAATNNNQGDSQSQWVSESIITKQPDNNKYVLLKNYNCADTDYFDYSTVGTATYNSESTTSNPIPGVSGKYVSNRNVNTSVADSQYYLFSYCTASLITGIFYQQNMWNSGGEMKGAFLTAKDNEYGGVNVRGVITTQYIDYSVDDLLSLDGVKTKGNSNNSVSYDEQRIINIIMQHILSTNSGKSVAMTAFGDYARTSMTSDYLTGLSSYLDALQNSQGFVNSYVEALPYIDDAYDLAFSNSQSFREYLATISTSDFTKKELIMMYATASKENFISVINYLLSDSSGYYAYLLEVGWFTGDYIWNEATNSEVYPELVDYIDLFIASGKTDEEITVLLEGLNSDTSSSFIDNKPSNEVDIVLQTTDGYTFDDFTGKVENTTIGGINYLYSLTANSNLSTITFNPLYQAELTMVFSGTITVNGVAYTNNSPAVRKWTGISAQTTDVICSSGTKIYDIYLELFHDILQELANQNTVIRYMEAPETSSYSRKIVVNSNTALNYIFDTAWGGFRGTIMTITYRNTTGSSVTMTIGSTNYTLPSSSTVQTFTTERFSNGQTIRFSGEVDIYQFINEDTTTNFNTEPTSLTSYTKLTLNNMIYDEVNKRIFMTNDMTINYIASSSETLKISAYRTGSAANLSINGSSIGSIGTSVSTFDYSTATAGTYALTVSDSAMITGFIRYSSKTFNENFIANDIAIKENKKFNTISDFSTVNNQTITSSNQSLAGTRFTVNGSTSLPVSIVDSKLSMVNGIYSFSKAISLPGSGTRNAGNISFTSAVSDAIYVFASGIGNLYLTDGTNTYSNTMTGANCYAFTLPNNRTTNYYLYSDSGCMIYKIALFDELVEPFGGDTDKFLTVNAAASAILSKYGNYKTFVDIFHKVNSMTGTNREGDTNYLVTKSNQISTISFTIDASNQGGSLVLNAYGKGTVTLKSESAIVATYDLSQTADTYTFEALTASSYTLEFNDCAIVNSLSYGATSFDMSSNTNAFFSLINIERHSALFDNDYLEVVKLLYATTGSDINLYNLLTKEQIVNIISLVASKDSTKGVLDSNNAFMELISLDSVSIELLKEILQNVSQFSDELLFEVMEIIDVTSLTDEQKEVLIAAYISTDYLTNIEILSESIIHEMLSEMNEDYCFINDDNTINNAKFISLMEYLGFNLSTDGFGIYALSSSEGILNGNFIPDNLSIESMDANYALVDNIGFVITNDSSSDWRGGNTDLEGSVNNGFHNDMKQLVKSIATTVFEMELISNEYTLYSSSDLIDVKNGIIYFYIPNNYVSDITSLSFNVNTALNSYLLSYLAIWSISDENITIVPNANVGGVSTATFTVTAEDRTVVKEYTINLVTTESVSLSIDEMYINNIQSTLSYQASSKTYTSSDSVAYENGHIVLNVTTENIASGTDLSKYITIDGLTTGFSYEYAPLVETLDGSVLGTGTAQISIYIDANMAKGEHDLVIDLPSNDSTYHLLFEKEAGTMNNLVSIVHEGVEYTTFNNNTLNSGITFGRGYSLADFTTLNDGVPAYLDGIEVSPRATFSVSASIWYDNGSGLQQDVIATNKTYTQDVLLTYVVTITVTAESGDVATYYHRLTEIDPFASAKNNGDFDTNEDVYLNNYLAIYNNGEIDSTTNMNSAGEASVEHYRGDMPKYRMSYVLNGFYTSNTPMQSYLSYIASISPSSNNASGNLIQNYTLEIKNYGYLLNFTDDAEPGDYVFNLVYSVGNVTWGDYTYERSYQTPDITVTKRYSTDAQLKRITFISSAANLANIATVLSTSEIRPNVDSSMLLPGESNYASLISNPESNNIYSATDGIHYTNEAAQNALEYYVVGTVSDASLEEYAPTFYIEDHAELYKYVEYDSIRYLFVPYDAEGKTEIFLVSMDWTSVYLTQLDENNALQAVANISIINKDFTYNGLNYTLNQYSGMASNDNMSLYMDYIGTPEENHFYYVDYIILSEEAINIASSTNFKLYHIALVDSSNTIYFDVTVTGPLSLDLNSIYLSIYNYEAQEKTAGTSGYDKGALNSQISNFIEYSETINDVKYYYLMQNLQVLKRGFFYFYLDLPDGYACEYEITSRNKGNTYNLEGDKASYLPPASIVTQRISLTINVIDYTTTDVTWGEGLETQYGCLAIDIARKEKE